MLLDQVEGDNLARVRDLRDRATLALLASGSLSAKGWRETFADHEAGRGELVDWLFPWAKDAAAAARKTEFTGLRDLWIANFGDPDDPEVAARIEATAAALAAQRTGA